MVQSPFYPEGPVCHVYVLHPPGGVVGGDTLELDVRLAGGAHALLTTPAATKLYRSAGPRARIEQRLTVADGAVLEWLPQENLAFRGAHAHLSTRVELHAGARFLGWEAVCLGRPASGEGFERGTLRQDLELWRDGAPLMIERNLLHARSPLMDAAWGLGGRCALASLLLYPCEEHLLSAARSVLDGFRAAATEVDGALACRLLGTDMLELRQLLLRLWQALRPRFLGRPAVAPRIWAT
jgi:urease accessory protein